MSKDSQYLTSEKIAELKKEFEYLRTDRRKEVAEHLEYAKKLGDLSENAEYHQAREEQAEVEDRISRLENILKNAKVAEVKNSDVVSIGSTVSLEKGGDKKVQVFKIVGSEESNMAEGKISDLSPIGKSILGHKKGDNVKVVTPKGGISYTILEIK